MATYRIKSNIVEAEQWCHGDPPLPGMVAYKQMPWGMSYTVNGKLVGFNDWVITTKNGVHYLCKDKIFTNEYEEEPNECYGQELILDLHGCNVSLFTRKHIECFLAELCDEIDMERCDLHFWDDEGVPEKDKQTNLKTKGISAVQFIITSTIVIHTLELMKTAFINIFSCKDFNLFEAEQFAAHYFQAETWTAENVPRR